MNTNTTTTYCRRESFKRDHSQLPDANLPLALISIVVCLLLFSCESNDIHLGEENELIEKERDDNQNSDLRPFAAWLKSTNPSFRGSADREIEELVNRERESFDARYSYVRDFFKIVPNPQWQAFKTIRYGDDIMDVFVPCENIHPGKVEANDFVLVISKRGENVFSSLKMLPRDERLSDRITAVYHDGKVYLEVGDKNRDGEYVSRNVGFLVKDSVKSDVSTRATDCWEEVSYRITAIVFEREGDGYSGGGVFAEDRKMVCSGSGAGGGGGGVSVPGPAAGAGGIPSYSSPFGSGGGGSSGSTGSGGSYGSSGNYGSGGGGGFSGGGYGGGDYGGGGYGGGGGSSYRYPAFPDGMIDFAPMPGYMDMEVTPEGKLLEPDAIDEIILDDSFKDTKAECIYNKLLNLSGGFKKAIQKFDGEFPVSHLYFSVSYDLSPNVNGITYPPQKFSTKIEINGNNLNRPNLSIARTLVHETIHAEMFRKLLSAAQKGELNTDEWTQAEIVQYLQNMQNDFPGIYHFYYLQYKKYGEEWDHEQMAGYYRGYMVNLLKQFDPSQPEELYEALAWEGLKSTEIWNSLSSAEKSRINSLAKNYNDKGGEPCE